MNAAATTLWQLTFSVPRRQAEEAEAVLNEALGAELQSVSQFEGTGADERQISALIDRRADPQALGGILAHALGGEAPAVHMDRVPDKDWVTAALDRQPPITEGRYFVYGSHVTAPPPAGSIALRIDAATAFGTGSHESTRGCLRALGHLADARRYRNPLDLGCGTGVLAMAAARTFRAPVLASDIDPAAVAVARANANLNDLGDDIEVVCADGLDHPRIRLRAPFDLVTANILADPLSALAPDLRAAVAPGGVFVLSGILAAQEAGILAAYRAQDFAMERRFDLDGWRTLILSRP